MIDLRIFLTTVALFVAVPAYADDVKQMLNEAGAVPADDKVVHPANPYTGANAPGQASTTITVAMPAGGNDNPVDETDATNRKLSHDAAQTVYGLEMESRVLDAQVKKLKLEGDVAKAQADIIKAKREAKLGPGGADKGASAENGSATAYNENSATNNLPHLSVRWIAGKDKNLEAMVNVPQIGNYMIRIGSPVPGSPRLTVKVIEPDGLIASDADGNLFPITFGR